MEATEPGCEGCVTANEHIVELQHLVRELRHLLENDKVAKRWQQQYEQKQLEQAAQESP